MENGAVILENFCQFLKTLTALLNRGKKETTQKSIKWRMDKQNVVYQ